MPELDVSWADSFDLFRYALLSAAVAGVVCPLVGNYLFLRRTSFYGIALPQFATVGVVFSYVLMPWWIAHVGIGELDVPTAHEHPHEASTYHLAWAGAFTLLGLGVLVLAGRGQSTELGRMAAALAIAMAATFLLGQSSPFGKEHVDELLRGEVLFLDRPEFVLLAVVLGAVLVLLLWFQRDILLASFDPESARVLGQRVRLVEALLGLATAATVAFGTMMLGPTLVFGLLVLPPLAARRWARSMTSFQILSVAFGVAAVALGTYASFELDLPYGPAIVGAAAIGLVPGAIVRRA